MSADEFYIIVADDGSSEFCYNGTVNLINTQACGYKSKKCKSNMMKRLHSAALTVPGQRFYLMRAVGEAMVPPQCVIKDYET